MMFISDAEVQTGDDGAVKEVFFCLAIRAEWRRLNYALHKQKEDT
jgi:hypothetical protein